MGATEQPARIGVDIGGTFTDFVLEIGNRRHTAKTLTTADAPERGVLEGLRMLLSEAGVTTSQVGLIIHGTTLATNALIERKGATTAFVTTEGFRDILEMRGEDRYEQYDLSIEMPQPLVARHMRFVVPERIDARGGVRVPLDEEAARAVAERLKALDVTSVAVGFLHSYVNPVHEERFAEILATVLPDAFVSLSFQVSPEMREYERFSTTCANAYVRPKMELYLTALRNGLASEGFDCPLLLMQSSGGLTTVETAVQFPVRLIESGPAGGAIFASHVASGCGDGDEVLSFDMGGTTAKICLIDGLEPQTSRSFEAARVYRFKKGSGMPLRIPVIEMVEIGAGGGSLAKVDELNRITVGPDSAGSQPGPACYDSGGERPAVTDADLLTGKIDPDAFAGGRVRLNVERARRAVEDAVGQRLGLSATMAAFGINEIVDENMANAARVHAIESGSSLGTRTLIAFGGAAPLHVARVADSLGIDRFIVPKGAGVGSAVGFLRAPVSYEIVRSLYMRLDAFDATTVNDVLAEMETAARAVVEKAAFGLPLRVSRGVFMRYVGQGHELFIPVQDGPLEEGAAAALNEAFEEEYRRQYSRIVPHMTAEALTWTVRVTAQDDEAGQPVETYLKPVEVVPGTLRKLLSRESGTFEEVKVLARDMLKPGDAVEGPVLVVEDETTTVVTSGFDMRVDALGNIECRRKGKGRAAA